MLFGFEFAIGMMLAVAFVVFAILVAMAGWHFLRHIKIGPVTAVIGLWAVGVIFCLIYFH